MKLKYARIVFGWMPLVALLSIASEGKTENIPLSKLLEQTESQLKNTSVYLIATAWNEERFAKNFATCMKETQESLAEQGAAFQVHLRCDGRPEDQKAFAKAFQEVGVPENGYTIHLNEKNLGVFKTRLALLRDIREAVENDLQQGKQVYVIPMDSDDYWRKNGILTLIAYGLYKNADYIYANPKYVYETPKYFGENSLEEEMKKNMDDVEVQEERIDSNYVQEEGFAFFGFQASCLYGKLFEHYMESFPKISDATWMFFNNTVSFDKIVCCKANYELPLYLQHDDSSIHSPLLTQLQDMFVAAEDPDTYFKAMIKEGEKRGFTISKEARGKRLLLDRRILFQAKNPLVTQDEFSTAAVRKGGQNSLLTKEIFTQKLSWEHRWWQSFCKTFGEALVFPEISQQESFNSLLQEDANQPLSSEKVMKYFGAFFEKITTMDPVWDAFKSIAETKQWMRESSVYLISEGEAWDKECVQKAYFLFGCYEKSEEGLFSSLTRDDKDIERLYECLKNIHIYAHLFTKILEQNPSLKQEEGEAKRKILLEQDTTKPLSKEFIQEHFKEIIEGLGKNIDLPF